MKKIFATILVATATLGFVTLAAAETREEKATYKATKDAAADEYRISRAKCKSLSGNPKNVCIEEAKAAEKRAKAEAEAMYKNTLKARIYARMAIADADYAVAKAKCGSQNGNAKDVCIKEAKAVRIAAQADAQADKKVTEARKDARDDKRKAEYKIAVERCDALAGAAKDTCIASAKEQFGK